MPDPKDGDNNRRGNGGTLWRLVGFVVTVCVGGILIPDVREWLGLPNRPQPVIVVPSPGPDRPPVHVQPHHHRQSNRRRRSGLGATPSLFSAAPFLLAFSDSIRAAASQSLASLCANQPAQFSCRRSSEDSRCFLTATGLTSLTWSPTAAGHKCRSRTTTAAER